MDSSIFSKLINLIMNIMGKIFSFTDMFCIIIIIFAIYSYMRVHKNVKKNIKSINHFIINIDDIQGEPAKRLFIVEEKDLFNGNEYLYKLWNKYKFHAINNNIQGKYPDISTYFNRFNLIDMPGERKIAEIIPGILTALGILGTFLGLQEGISFINMDTPESVKQSIQFLTSGMSLAFITSIVGIISSTIWSRFDRRRYKNYIEVLDRFYTVFNEKYPVFNSECFFNEMLTLQKDSTEAVKHMATDFSLELSKALSQSINETILPSIDSSINNVVNRDIRPTFETMADIVDNFTTNASENQIDSINIMVTGFLDKLNSVVNLEFDNLANTLSELIKWQMETKDKLEELLEEIKETTLNQKEANVDSEEVLTRYSELFDRFEEVSSVLERELIDVNETVDKLRDVSNISGNLLEQQYSIQQDTNNVIDLIGSDIDSLKENMDISKTSLENVNESLGESTTAFSQSLKDGLESTFNIFDDGLSEISKRLSGTILEIQETVDELPRAISLLTKELEDSTNHLNNSVNDINSIYKNINVKIDELKSEGIA